MLLMCECEVCVEVMHACWMLVLEYFMADT